MTKHTSFIFLVYSILFISNCSSNQCSSRTSVGKSQATVGDESDNDEVGPCMIGHTTPLSRLDGVKVRS